jgi:hypothetical protein
MARSASSSLPFPERVRNASAGSPAARQTSPDACGRMVLRAARAVERAAGRQRELTSAEVARRAIAVLPRADRHRIRRFLAARGWDSPSAMVPFDGLERMSAAELPTALREVARIALFGPGGQGRMTDQKARDALYERCLAEIMREGLDHSRLERVAARILNSREVAIDTVLTGMLRAAIAQRAAELARSSERPPPVQIEDPGDPRRPRAGSPEWTQQQVQGSAARLVQRLEECIAHYQEVGAAEMLERLEKLARQYGDVVDPALLQRARDAFRVCRERTERWRQMVDRLADEGVEAARHGDEARADWIVRRLHAVHALRGDVLSEPHMLALCARIRQAEDAVHDQEAIQALRERERRIAAELRQLAQTIREFHTVARTFPPESPEFRTAAEQYRAAVRDVKHHDQEWLTSVFIELEDMIGELHDHVEQAHGHVDMFIDRVRDALLRMRAEIREIHAEKLDGFLRAPPTAPSA